MLHKHIPSYAHVARSLGRGRKKSPRRPKRSNFSCFLSASPKRPAAAVTMCTYIIHIAGSMYIYNAGTYMLGTRYYYTFTVRLAAVNNIIYNIDG